MQNILKTKLLIPKIANVLKDTTLEDKGIDLSSFLITSIQ
jgi:hypothetical protein